MEGLGLIGGLRPPPRTRDPTHARAWRKGRCCRWRKACRLRKTKASLMRGFLSQGRKDSNLQPPVLEVCESVCAEVLKRMVPSS